MKFKPQTVNDCRPMGATCFKATNKAVVCMKQWGKFRFEITFRLVYNILCLKHSSLKTKQVSCEAFYGGLTEQKY